MPNGLYTDNDRKPVIVRAKDAGVHFGTLVSYEGRTVVLENSHRLWSWKAAGGVALSGVAATSLVASESKVDALVARIVILDACEIIECTLDAAASIAGAWAHA
jgi:hypothetical protein